MRSDAEEILCSEVVIQGATRKVTNEAIMTNDEVTRGDAEDMSCSDGEEYTAVE